MHTTNLLETSMYNYELLPRLTYLTLTVNKDAEYWEEQLEFIGDTQQWNKVHKMEQKLCQ
jgi:hypothetical protein